MLASGTWYTSATFWTGTGTVIAAVAFTVSVAFWRLGPPRRLLTYSMQAVTPLLRSTAPGIPDSDIRVTVRDHVLRSPHVASVRIESRSRRDIRSTDFDEGEPLVFDVSVPVIELLGRDTLSKNMPHLNPGIEGSKIAIEPTLIRRRQVIILDLLTDGRPSVTCDSSLVDVTVREQMPGNVEPTWATRMTRIIFVLILISLALIGIGQNHHPAINDAGKAILSVSLISLFGVSVGGMIAMIRARHLR